MPGKFLWPAVLVCFLGLNTQNVFSGNGEIYKREITLAGRQDRPVHPVKNVILMIPDGCSLATVSAARWYQWLLDPGKPFLNIDPYICGTVRTSCSNAPIGDSAPTTSCYMTGELSRSGFISTYPPADVINDIFPIDSTKAYQPLMTVLEASRLLYGKSTGLVFTCEFPQATPADCSAHDYDRKDYTSISSQMVHNNIDVVIGGGVGLLRKDMQDYLKSKGYEVQTDNLSALRSFSGKKLWSLFCPRDMPYDLDRDTTKYPSLAEMTGKAINALSLNKKGFFLMVEGSKVDWAAHGNDPAGMITDFLAFDKACKVALDFAKRDGNTAVVILPDHGNSGFSIGCSRCPDYSHLTKDQLFGNILNYKRTAEGIAEIINVNKPEKAKEIFEKYTGIELGDDQISALSNCRDYSQSPVPQGERKGPSLSSVIAKYMTENTCFGFTTNGHTGEDVFLAVFNPKRERPEGERMNFEINEYLCKLLKLEGKLKGLTSCYFMPHVNVFKTPEYIVSMDTTLEYPVLTVTKGNRRLKVTDDSNIVNIDGKDVEISTVVVYVDKNKTFYLPENLADFFKSGK